VCNILITTCSRISNRYNGSGYHFVVFVVHRSLSVCQNVNLSVSFGYKDRLTGGDSTAQQDYRTYICSQDMASQTETKGELAAVMHLSSSQEDTYFCSLHMTVLC
jgi:hypothetical protein